MSLSVRMRRSRPRPELQILCPSGVNSTRGSSFAWEGINGGNHGTTGAVTNFITHRKGKPREAHSLEIQDP